MLGSIYLSMVCEQVSLHFLDIHRCTKRRHLTYRHLLQYISYFSRNIAAACAKPSRARDSIWRNPDVLKYPGYVLDP